MGGEALLFTKKKGNAMRAFLLFLIYVNSILSVSNGSAQYLFF